jgi:hypothetical protein
MENETFYAIATKYKGGRWNKLAKAYDLPVLRAVPFFWELQDAKTFFNNNLDPSLREFYAIFKLDIALTKIEKVFDGRV